MSKTINKNSSMRFGKIEDLDRSFDIDYWQKLGTNAIFDAAWELVKNFHIKQGCKEDELRLQRSIYKFERFPG